MSAHVFNWHEAFEAGAERCGGKGFNLARLARYGFSVPRGGVIAADVYSLVMSTPQVADAVRAVSTLGADDVLTTRAQADLERVRLAVVSTPLPAGARAELGQLLTDSSLETTAVAVRSSAVGEDSADASFAGIHESVLNVTGLSAVSSAVLRCYASLWTPGAVAYRRRLRYTDHETRCAVVVQAMVHAPGRTEPAAAGVAFSCDPQSGRRFVVVINAASGMGDKVVLGAVNPDQYVVVTQRSAFTIESPRIGGAAAPATVSGGAPSLAPEGRTPVAEPVLTAEQQRVLARAVWRVHWALGDGQDPQDVEWAFDGERFWIVQARPVTHLPRYTFGGCRHMPAYWSTANIKDAVPGVMSTAAWSLIVEAIDGVLYGAPLAAGIATLPGLETVRRYAGRAYFDLTTLQWMMYDGLGVLPAEIIKTIGGHQPEIAVPPDPFDGLEGSRRRKRSLRLLRALVGLPRRMQAAGDRHLENMRQYAALDFNAMSDDELHDWLARVEREAMDVAPLIGIANTYPGPWQMLAEGLLRPVAGAETTAILSRLLAGGGNVTSAEQSYRLYALAEVAREDGVALHWLGSGAPAAAWITLRPDSAFKRELARFLDEFGHRAVYEADIINPRWVDDPAYILDQVRAHLRTARHESPREMAVRTRRQGETAMAGRTTWRRPLIRWAVARLQRALALREYSKSVLASVVWPTRRCYLAIGRRLWTRGLLAAPEGVFHLSKIDLVTLLRHEWDGRGARELSDDRAARREAWLAEPAPPDVVVEGGTDGHARMAVPAAQEGQDGWSGIGVSSGQASGPVRVIRHPHDGDRLAHGDVLVAPSTDPGWTPLFLRASAIVMESGGYLSHGAIVAREFGLPAVVNIPGILDQLSDGDVVLVDGDAARVRRL